MTIHKLIHGTCMSMNEIEDNSIDFSFTSPPYYNVKNYSQKEGCIGEQDDYNRYIHMMRCVFKNIYDKLKEGSYFIINIADVISDGERYPIPWHYFTICESIGFKSRGTIIWNKFKKSLSSKRFGVLMQHPYVTYYYPNNVYEFCMLFSKGKIRHVENIEQYKIDVKKAQKFETDIWYIEPAKGNPHPAPFPYELAKAMLYVYCPKGGTFLEPFLGSGTTMKAARDLDINSYGYEINEDYLKIIKKSVGFESGIKIKDYVRDFAMNEYHIIKQTNKSIDEYDSNIDYIYDFSGHRNVIKKEPSVFSQIKNNIIPEIKEIKSIVKKCLVCNCEWIIEHPGNVWSYKKEMYVDYIEGFCHYCNEEMIVDKKEYMDKLNDDHDSNMVDLITGESIVNHKFDLSI